MPRRVAEEEDWEDEEPEDWTPDEEEEEFDESLRDAPEEETIACPCCQKQIHEQSQRCPYCETYISEEEPITHIRPTWILVGALLCLFAVYRWIFGG